MEKQNLIGGRSNYNLSKIFIQNSMLEITEDNIDNIFKELLTKLMAAYNEEDGTVLYSTTDEIETLNISFTYKENESVIATTVTLCSRNNSNVCISITYNKEKTSTVENFSIKKVNNSNPDKENGIKRTTR